MHRGAPYRHSDQELTNHMAIPIVFHHEEDFTYVTFARLDEPQGLKGLGRLQFTTLSKIVSAWCNP